jgi:methylenetetrahydrofolate reductase (NADPH)
MSLFEKKIQSTDFVVTTELTPPKGIDLSEFFAKADALRNLVDAINITESPRETVTGSPSRPTCWAAACSASVIFCS